MNCANLYRYCGKVYAKTADAFFAEYPESEDDTRADDGVDDAFIDPDDFCDHSSEAGGVF